MSEDSFDFSKVTFYVPVHGNFSQVEHTAAFLKLAPSSRIFVYDGFNTEHDKMVRFYREDPQWKSCNLTVETFSMKNIIRAISEEPVNRRIIFLLTASVNYPFGRAQLQMLRYLQSRCPSRILDVFVVGHCMYGCESCGLSEHNVPIFFTRYHNHTLPYTADDLKKTFWQTASGAPAKKRVLICPTVGVETFMNNLSVLDELQSLAKELEPHDVVFAVKLHGFCFLEDDEGRKPHLLFSLSDEDRAGAKFLRLVFGSQVVPETYYNILPFFEAADIIVTDVCSSVPFEAQQFSHLTVIANENAGTRAHDPKYVSMLNTFSTPAELRALLMSAINDNKEVVDGVKTHKIGQEGAEFFASKYGNVTGHEPERVASLRGWKQKLEEAEKNPVELVKVDSELDAFRAKFDSIFSTVDVMNYVACGEEIPKAVGEISIFSGMNEAQLKARGIPQSLWAKLSTKIGGEVFDAGQSFQFAQLVDEDEEEESSEKSESPADKPVHMGLISGSEGIIAKESDIFLIDHAWTATIDRTREQLSTIPGLLDRMERLVEMRASLPPLPEEQDPQIRLQNRVDRMYKCMWMINDQYVMRSPDGDDVAIWYVMDEVGTAIGHSDEPNCKCVPFIDAKSGNAYSVMWPIRDIEPGELLTRDFVSDKSDSLVRAVSLIPYGESVSSFEPIDDEELNKHAEQARAKDKRIVTNEPPSLPPAIAELPFFEKDRKTPIKVCSDSKLLCKYLTRREFIFVEEKDKADIIWQGTDDFKDYASLHEHVFVNQMPNETCVCFKNNLAKTVSDAYGGPRAVDWLPETYDLTKSMPEFVARFQERAGAGEDNHWIVKPFNAARSKDIVITNDLGCIVKLGSAQEPMIACKYVEQPACYEGRKYDLRFLVYARAERGWKMPQFSLYNTFWIRFANKQYALDDLWDYEKHFTVMNYRAGSSMTHIRDSEFVPWFDKTHGAGSWDTVLGRVKSVLAKLFYAACEVGHIAGAGSPEGCTADCFAVYGIDLLLTSDLHVKLEEINFGPDCTRACNYDEHFYNKTFGHFFFGELENVSRFL